MNSKSYFPNNWQSVYDADESCFETCTYEEFDEMSTLWLLNSSHRTLMRIENTRTGKIKEKAYKTVNGTLNKLRQLVEDPDVIITLVDNDEMHQLSHVNPLEEL